MALKALKIENNVAAASKANERKLAKSQLIISVAAIMASGGNGGKANGGIKRRMRKA
jgi:hypothetical protein